jgi:hypothetical protein
VPTSSIDVSRQTIGRHGARLALIRVDDFAVSTLITFPDFTIEAA